MMKTVFLHCCYRHEVKWKWSFQSVWLSSTRHTNNHKWPSSCDSIVKVLCFHSFCSCLQILCKTYGRVPTSRWLFFNWILKSVQMDDTLVTIIRESSTFQIFGNRVEKCSKTALPRYLSTTPFRNMTFCWLQIHYTARKIINTKSG